MTLQLKNIVQLILLSLMACNGSNRNVSSLNDTSDSLRIIQPKVFSFPVDNDHAERIGFIELENNYSIGITSLCVVDNYIYLTDEYHKNIKRVDIITSEIICSNKLTDSTYFKQFNDIVEFNNSLYITSSENNIFVVDKDLKKYFSLKLPTKGGYPINILSKTDSTLDFCIEIRDSAYRINTKNIVTLERKLDNKERIWLTNYFDIYIGNIKYKKLKYFIKDNQEFILIEDKKVKLLVPYKYCSDAYNIDFNNDFLVIFNTNAKEFNLYVYPLVDYP
jgi:hypothetical protein